MSALDVALIRALRAAAVHLPGGELATLLRTTGDTIDARIRELREAGFEIEERPGLGYRLLGSPDRLIADDLLARLGESRFIREFIVLAETDSTNERASHLGRSGARSGVAIFAERQTAGRGRFGRRWDSAAHLGLWFSLLLRPGFPLALWPRLTTWAGVAVARAIDATAPLRASIKWPNDVLLDGRKTAGILIETGVDRAGENFAVVGVGVNANHTLDDFPGELRASATSLRLARGRQVPRPELAVTVLSELEALWPLLPEDFPQLLREATRRSALLGRWIAVRAGDELIEGVAESLGDAGELLLRTADGNSRQLAAGEATLRTT